MAGSKVGDGDDTPPGGVVPGTGFWAGVGVLEPGGIGVDSGPFGAVAPGAEGGGNVGVVPGGVEGIAGANPGAVGEPGPRLGGMGPFFGGADGTTCNPGGAMGASFFSSLAGGVGGGSGLAGVLGSGSGVASAGGGGFSVAGGTVGSVKLGVPSFPRLGPGGNVAGTAVAGTWTGRPTAGFWALKSSASRASDVGAARTTKKAMTPAMPKTSPKAITPHKTLVCMLSPRQREMKKGCIQA